MKPTASAAAQIPAMMAKPSAPAGQPTAASSHPQRGATLSLGVNVHIHALVDQLFDRFHVVALRCSMKPMVAPLVEAVLQAE